MLTIKIENLKKYFGKTKAVDGISFEVKEGEIFGFLGPNGAGKTTTIRCMMDFIRPDDGKIIILDQDAQKNSSNIMKDVGFLPAESSLYDNWNGQDHINLLQGIRGNSHSADNLIKMLDFDPNKKVKDLSTGNKQKLGLILSLMYQPKILILDEPTTGLDPLLQQTIYDTLRRFSKKGTTIFMSSHNLAEVERLCDRVCIIKKGKIVGIENVKELKKKKLYTVHVYFDKKVNKDKIESKRIEITKEFDDGYVLTVREDINLLLDKLEKLELKDLEIKYANLENIFLEFYK